MNLNIWLVHEWGQFLLEGYSIVLLVKGEHCLFSEEQ